MADRRKSLMSHELTRAKLRLLTPISEDSSSPRFRRNKNMVMITDKIDERRLPSNEEIMSQLRETQQDRSEIAEAYSNDLKHLVESYINEPVNNYGDRELPRRPRELRVLHRPDAHCECCEVRNRENRERRKDQYPENYGYWTENPNAVEMIPYGTPGQYSPESLIPRGRLPVMTERPRIQVLYPNYLADRPQNAGQPYESMLFPTAPGVPGQGDHQHDRAGSPRGSATLLYPYTPRNMHGYSSLDYDIYGYNTGNLAGPSDYERHLMGDIMAAAARYDTNMNRLENQITNLTPRYPRAAGYDSGRL